MTTNLVHNVREALDGFPVSQVFGWLDSTVALHWIRGGGDFKQFVGNRERKIQEKAYIQWRHVCSEENPADLGSRGGKVSEKERLWWEGSKWLPFQETWPDDIVTSPNPETIAETKPLKDLFKIAVEEPDEFDQLLTKWNLWKTLRICAWISRFIRNTSRAKRSESGPLSTEEIEERKLWWIVRVQERNKYTAEFVEDREKLNLQPNRDGILVCHGRIQGNYPTYLPDKDHFTEKLVQHCHKVTLHGGVGLTMGKVRDEYWIPRLRRLARRVRKNCFGCKRFHVSRLPNPQPGKLPKDRSVGEIPFQVVGIDYAGPIKYRARNKQERKAYILVYACSLTRALYLEVTKTLSTEEFLSTLKRFIARKGRPEKVYSDNAKTFVAGAKWLRQIMHDEKFNDDLAKMSIKWQFNLSRAPWWGGQYERLIGLIKQALYKSIGNGHLTWAELEEVILDIEVALNNRPLSYVEEDVQLPLLTPNTLQFGRPNILPEQSNHRIQDRDLRKRAKYIQLCKDVLWKRWSSEYLKSLRERHNMKYGKKTICLNVGDVVVVKGEEKNRGKWKLGIVKSLITGKDGVVRGARLRTGQSNIERAVQHLYPMELSCDVEPTPAETSKLRVDVPEFRPKRNAAAIAECRIKDTVESEDD